MSTCERVGLAHLLSAAHFCDLQGAHLFEVWILQQVALPRKDLEGGVELTTNNFHDASYTA